MFEHKKEATHCNSIGGSQNNKARVWKKGWKIGGVDDKKNSTLTCNGKVYNEHANKFVCSNLYQAPTTKNTP